jgi:monoamine oxidase
MARTPLFGQLQQLVKDHGAAAALGVEPDDVRERRRLSRRDLLARGAQIGAVAAIAGPVGEQVLAGSAAATSKGAAPRIAIVGGGIAGLTAALTLSDAGYSATVYEANTDRIGGRMHSDSPLVSPSDSYWANAQVSEFCGELIDTAHKTPPRAALRTRDRGPARGRAEQRDPDVLLRRPVLPGQRRRRGLPGGPSRHQ